MIVKSYELSNKIVSLGKYVYLFYGENKGLKDDLKNHTINFIKKNKEVEIINFNEDQLLKLIPQDTVKLFFILTWARDIYKRFYQRI